MPARSKRYRGSLAPAAYYARARAIEDCCLDRPPYARETIDLAPDRAGIFENLGLGYEAQGDRPRAIAAFRRMAAMREQRAEAEALLAYAYVQARQPAEARRALAIALADRRDVSSVTLAAALDAVGNRSAAIRLLRKLPPVLLAQITLDPRLENLRRYFYST
ncbi:MAG TPA: hypothetical protein VIN40_05475 [Candidatus Tyrphobacter sp.]